MLINLLDSFCCDHALGIILPRNERSFKLLWTRTRSCRSSPMGQWLLKIIIIDEWKNQSINQSIIDWYYVLPHAIKQFCACTSLGRRRFSKQLLKPHRSLDEPINKNTREVIFIFVTQYVRNLVSYPPKMNDKFAIINCLSDIYTRFSFFELEIWHWRIATQRWKITWRGHSFLFSLCTTTTKFLIQWFEGRVIRRTLATEDLEKKIRTRKKTELKYTTLHY